MLQILIHILPQEIDQLEQLLIQLKYSSNYISPEDKVIVDAVLNLNLVEWDKSTLPKSFFIDKFNNLEKLTQTWAETKFEVNEDGTIQGCVSHRRRAANYTEAKAILAADPDMVFSPTLLYHLINAIKMIPDEYYILTPQVTPMWDESWRVLVNENYLHEPAGEGFKTRDPYKHAQCAGEVSIRPIDQFKFGGGWMTVISTPLLKYVGVPDGFGHYGLEDTFIMTCSQIMRQKGMNVRQFILENEVIVEDQLFRFNPYKQHLETINKQEEFKRNAHANFEAEVIKFVNTK
jgi:hypothetical protein